MQRSERRRQPMTQLARICAAALIAILPACSAQTANHKSKPAPKPEPTAPELFEFIRGSLLTLSPDDGINDNIEVTFNWTSNVMTITQPTGHCDLFLNALTRNFLRSGTTVGTCVAGGSLHAGGGLGWQRAAWRAADMVPPRTRQRAGASEKQKGWWRSTQRLRAPVGIRWREPGLGARPDSEPCVFARTSPLPGPPMPVLSSAGDTRVRLGSEPWL